MTDLGHQLFEFYALHAAGMFMALCLDFLGCLRQGKGVGYDEAHVKPHREVGGIDRCAPGCWRKVGGKYDRFD
jgi:hypothetical protein